MVFWCYEYCTGRHGPDVSSQHRVSVRKIFSVSQRQVWVSETQKVSAPRAIIVSTYIIATRIITYPEASSPSSRAALNPSSSSSALQPRHVSSGLSPTTKITTMSEYTEAVSTCCPIPKFLSATSLVRTTAASTVLKINWLVSVGCRGPYSRCKLLGC
jgi:hypothetical protein